MNLAGSSGPMASARTTPAIPTLSANGPTRTVASRAKRAFHNKVRTGCKTCKIRRVRCDEQKPACNRCVSTGRKCDGYATDPSPLASYSRPVASYSTSAYSSTDSPATSSTSFPPSMSLARSYNSLPSFHATAGLKLQFLHRDPDQVRAFHYFLTVAAPAIAGSFNTQFWTEDIPKVCYEDPAIWHAIVSLGTVYEDHVALAVKKNSTQPYQNLFALQQFNQCVKHLVKPGPQSSKDKWRALITSTIFTCVCMIEGLYEQARTHFKSGCSLLNELEAEKQQSTSQALPSPSPEHDQRRWFHSTTPKSSLIAESTTTIRAVLAGLELWLQGMANSGIVTMPTLLYPGDAVWSLWENYEAPRRPEKHQKILTSENIRAAKRAAESLLVANIFFSQTNGKEMERLYIERTMDIVTNLSALQRPIVRCFKELYKAMVLFGWELDESSEEPGGDTIEMAQLRLSLYFLSLYVAANRIFIVPPLSAFGMHEDYQTFPSACSTVVWLAEKIIASETSLKLRSRRTLLGSNPPLATPVSVVAIVAPPANLRRRATKILQRPRIEGFLDSSTMASLSEATLAVEEAADKEHQRRTAAEGLDSDPMLKGYFPGQDKEVHPLSRSYASGFESSSRGEGIVYIRTWRDQINGNEGRRVKVNW